MPFRKKLEGKIIECNTYYAAACSGDLDHLYIVVYR